MMTLPNTLILALVGNGLGSATEHDVPVADAYKAYKFRAAVLKAARAIEDKRRGLLESAGIADGSAFDAKLKDLRAIPDPAPGQKAELEEMQARLAKFGDLTRELMADTSELEGVKPMPYASFHALANENRSVPVPGTGRTADLFSAFAADLEGVLWTAPEEE